MKFRKINDEGWEFIKEFLPPAASTGRPRADDRKVINGILYVLITGCKWADMPDTYGSYVTAWRRLKRWQEEGAWERIVDSLQNEAYRKKILSMESTSLDSKTIQAKKGANV